MPRFTHFLLGHDQDTLAARTFDLDHSLQCPDDYRTEFQCQYGRILRVIDRIHNYARHAVRRVA